MFDLYYSWYSICSEKVLICLFEKGVAFKGHLIDLFEFDQVKPAYLAINPEGIVPTLVHERQTIPESTIINEFLNELIPTPPLAPADPHGRARMRYWVQQFQDFVYPSLAILSQPKFIAPQLRRRWTQAELESLIARKQSKEKRARQLRAVREGFSESELANAESRVIRVLDQMDNALRDGRDWLMGELSLADIAAAPNAYRCEIIGRSDLIETRPNVVRWYQRIIARESFVQCYKFAPSVGREG